MARVMGAAALTTFDVAPDGAVMRMHVADGEGQAGMLSLRTEMLTQLMMTLPRIAQRALRRGFRDDSLRVVYPVGRRPDHREQFRPGKLILTPRTPDGFELSCALDGGACASLTDGLAGEVHDEAGFTHSSPAWSPGGHPARLSTCAWARRASRLPRSAAANAVSSSA